MALTPGTRLGVYEVTAQIGEGGMGQVYRATDTRLKRQVAIKILPPSLAADHDRLARFQREAEVLASLNHPNIAAIYGLEESDGITALVMELVEGPTLAERIALPGPRDAAPDAAPGLRPVGRVPRPVRRSLGEGGSGPAGLPLEDVLAIAKQIAEALEAAHEQGIIHRDLKPANIKVRADGTVKVLDFGLAKAMEPAGGVSQSMSMSPTITTPAMTQAGMILGTAAYMSPEQAKGRSADRRSDVWAFGCVLYEMVSGRRAFAGDDVAEVLASVLAREPDWAQLPPTLLPTLGTCIRRCLHKDPRQRFGDMQSVHLALDGAFETAALQTTVAVPSSKTRRERWLWAGALIAVAAIAAAAARFLAVSPESPTTIRFTVSPPAGMRLATGVGTNVAISPDGRYVVLSITDAVGQPTLFVRALDDDALRELPGTSGASLPFWAPDSRGIGFFANGELKRTDRDGAPVQTVADAPAAQGGAWAPDGTFLVGATAGPLRRMPVGGGALVEMTHLDQSLKESSHRHPLMLPDGRHFLYLTSSVQPGGSVYAGSLDDDSKTLILASDSNADYLGGYLLFTRGGTLLAQRFDPAGLRVSGDPVAVASDIWFNPTVARASFAGADGTLVFRMTAPSTPTQLTWLDRSGREGEKVGEPADQTNLELSPDGTRLVLSIFDPAQQTRDLWIQDLKRGVRTRFTFGPNEDFSASWSPDGQRLVFSSVRSDVLDSFSQAADGSGSEELVFESTDNKYPGGWSNDGQLLLFNTGNARSRTGNDVWVLPMGQKQKPRVFLGGAFNETGGRFSPDGRWVSYQSAESGRVEVYVVPYPGPGGKWQVSTGGGGFARWNPNGRELLYLSNDGTAIMSVTVDGSGTAFQAATPQKLFEARFRNENYRGYGNGSGFVISPDGQRILANLQTNAPTAPDAITVVTNWTSLLRP